MKLKTAYLTGAVVLILIVIMLRDARFSEDVPLEGIKKLKQIVPAGRIYNCKEYGGALMYIGYPGWRITIDGRQSLYDRAIWQKYYYEAAGKTTLIALVSEHKPSAFILNGKVQAGLIRQLNDSNTWKKVYEKNNCVIFIPAT
jgi:hypothetical protein